MTGKVASVELTASCPCGRDAVWSSSFAWTVPPVLPAPPVYQIGCNCAGR